MAYNNPDPNIKTIAVQQNSGGTVFRIGRKPDTTAINNKGEQITLTRSHGYTVKAFNRDENGRVVSIVLSNPWNSGNNDEDHNRPSYKTGDITVPSSEFYKLKVAYEKSEEMD